MDGGNGVRGGFQGDKWIDELETMNPELTQSEMKNGRIFGL